jgi:glycosyltransferase involved in cell wall biosynthesis
MTSPVVSVVIPTYNRAHSIREAVASALAQTFTNLEVIVVDDGSRDGTDKVIQGFDDSRLRYVRLATNSGASAARNRGTAEARGEFIAFLDSDDRWHPSKLQKQLDAFARAPAAVGLVCTGVRHITRTGDIQMVWIPQDHGKVLPRQLAYNITGSGSNPLIRREILDRVGGWDVTLRSCQDFDLGIRICQVYAIAIVPEVLIDVSTEGNRITSNLDAQQQGMLAVAAKYRKEVCAQRRAVRGEIYHAYAFSFWHRRLRRKAFEYMIRSVGADPRYALEYIWRIARKAAAHTGALRPASPI